MKVSEFRIDNNRSLAEFTRDRFMYGFQFAQYYFTMRTLRENGPKMFDIVMGDYVREQVEDMMKLVMPDLIARVKEMER